MDWKHKEGVKLDGLNYLKDSSILRYISVIQRKWSQIFKTW